jgi:hypothetical protein
LRGAIRLLLNVPDKGDLMTLAIAALTILAAAGPSSVQGQSGPSIPAQFHGRWAANQAACKTEHFTTVITIDRRGWSSFEEGGEVTRVGQVRRGTHYFRLDNRAGANETTGSLAMRRVGARIVMSFDDDNDKPVHYTLIRCR